MEEKLYIVNYNDITDIVDEIDNHIILSKQDILITVFNFVKNDWSILPTSYILYELNKKLKYFKFELLELQNANIPISDHTILANSKLVIKSYPSYTDENNTVITPVINDYTYYFEQDFKIESNTLVFTKLESDEYTSNNVSLRTLMANESLSPNVISGYTILANPNYFKHFKPLLDEWFRIKIVFNKVKYNIFITENYKILKCLESKNLSITFKYVPDYNVGDLMSGCENHCEIESIGN